VFEKIFIYRSCLFDFNIDRDNFSNEDKLAAYDQGVHLSLSGTDSLIMMPSRIVSPNNDGKVFVNLNKGFHNIASLLGSKNSLTSLLEKKIAPVVNVEF
jgi:hypothetical protein